MTTGATIAMSKPVTQSPNGSPLPISPGMSKYGALNNQSLEQISLAEQVDVPGAVATCAARHL